MQKSKFQKDDTFLMQTGNILAIEAKNTFFHTGFSFLYKRLGTIASVWEVALLFLNVTT